MNSSSISLSNQQISGQAQQNVSQPSGQHTHSKGNQSQQSNKESSSSPAQETQKSSGKGKQKWGGVYISLMGWLIDKLCVGEVEEIMIEEGDTIRNAPLLNVLVSLFNSLASDDLLKVPRRRCRLLSPFLGANRAGPAVPRQVRRRQLLHRVLAARSPRVALDAPPHNVPRGRPR